MNRISRTMIASAGAVVFAAGVVACGSSSSSSPSESASAPSPAGTGEIPFADCETTTFGEPLAPLDPPANPTVYTAPPPMTIDESKLYQATISTAKGDIVLCLQPALAPQSVNNFVTLSRNKFYDGLTFHRVVPGFVVQGGDPQGSGSGGPGYSFPDEPVRQQYVDGAVAMANSGPNSNGSQFFIDIADNTTALQPLYNLFGKTSSGLDVAKQIKQGDVMKTVVVRQQT
ncbi:MAG: peptidylprolyl isomerase [Candidatus Nanopelagicales bacterium]